MPGGYENEGRVQKRGEGAFSSGGGAVSRFWVGKDAESNLYAFDAEDSAAAAAAYFAEWSSVGAVFLGDEAMVALEVEPYRLVIDQERMAELVRDQLDEWPEWVEDAAEAQLDLVLARIYKQALGKIEYLEEKLNEELGFGENGPGRPTKWETWRVVSVDPLKLAKED